MKYSSGSFEKSRVLPNFDHRLSMYALAASAAGVGALALAQPAEGKIVYTKAHLIFASNSTVSIDLNHDGGGDFLLRDIFISSHASSTAQLSVLPAPQNAVVGYKVNSRSYGSSTERKPLRRQCERRDPTRHSARSNAVELWRLEFFEEFASGTGNEDSAGSSALTVFDALNNARGFAALWAIRALGGVHYFLAVRCFGNLGHNCLLIKAQPEKPVSAA